LPPSPSLPLSESEPLLSLLLLLLEELESESEPLRDDELESLSELLDDDESESDDDDDDESESEDDEELLELGLRRFFFLGLTAACRRSCHSRCGSGGWSAGSAKCWRSFGLASCAVREGRGTYTRDAGSVQHSNVHRPGFRQRWHTGLPPPPLPPPPTQGAPGRPSPRPPICDGSRCANSRERAR
jgi:hypothetical protein